MPNAPLFPTNSIQWRMQYDFWLPFKLICYLCRSVDRLHLRVHCTHRYALNMHSICRTNSWTPHPHIPALSLSLSSHEFFTNSISQFLIIFIIAQSSRQLCLCIFLYFYSYYSISIGGEKVGGTKVSYEIAPVVLSYMIVKIQFYTNPIQFICCTTLSFALLAIIVYLKIYL